MLHWATSYTDVTEWIMAVNIRGSGMERESLLKWKVQQEHSAQSGGSRWDFSASETHHGLKIEAETGNVDECFVYEPMPAQPRPPLKCKSRSSQRRWPSYPIASCKFHRSTRTHFSKQFLSYLFVKYFFRYIVQESSSGILKCVKFTTLSKLDCCQLSFSLILKKVC